MEATYHGAESGATARLPNRASAIRLLINTIHLASEVNTESEESFGKGDRVPRWRPVNQAVFHGVR